MTSRAGLYGRESKDKTQSIADQLTLGQAAIAHEGWTLAATYTDGTSASEYAAKARKGWPQLLADLAAGKLDILVFNEVSRGSRDTIDWDPMLAMCRTRGVLIHVVTDHRTLDPRRARDMKDLRSAAVDASYEADRTSEQVRARVALAAARGQVHGAIPYGYVREYDPHTRKFVAQRPSEHAPLVVEIFERLAASDPIIGITRDLNARGIPSPTGKGWQRNAIRVIATNPAYLGLRRHRTNHKGKAPTDEVSNAVWPAIVDEDLFVAVQEFLGRPERRRTKPGKAKYLLSYVGTAPCGGQLQNRAGQNGRADRYACGDDACVSIARRDVDAVVEAAILARFRRPGRIRQLFEVDDTAARTARTEASRLRIQLEDARRSFEGPDGISADAMARKERTLMPLIEDAEARSRPAGMPGAVSRLLSAEDVREVWDGLSVAARREVVSALVTVVVGSPTQRLSRFAWADDRQAEALVRLGESAWKGDARTWRELWRDN